MLKKMEVLVCDCCTTTRPAVARIEVDVCARHRAQLVKRGGRDVLMMEPQTKTNPKQGLRAICPECGKNLTELGMARHMVQTHRQAPFRSEPKLAVAESPAEYTCPECGRTFGKANGLGAHRWRQHQIRGVHRQSA
jgi:predicted RNA-binding Zn-ribbon protein involved in translation (DUF1610 family)